MHKCGLCRRAVSVCPSVTFVYCVETSKCIPKLFFTSGSHNILVFPHQTLWQYSDGNPLNGGVECRGSIKIAIIIIIIIITDLYSAFKSKDTEALDAAQED